MQGYSSKKEFIDEINKRAVLFINEFSEITDENKDTFVDEVDKSPAQMIAYQLGWMNLILFWEKENKGCIINGVDRINFYQCHFFNKKS